MSTRIDGHVIFDPPDNCSLSIGDMKGILAAMENFKPND